MRAIAFDKLVQLMGTACPYSRLITDDKNTHQLISAGLMAKDPEGFTITPSGLRVLADQMQLGYVARAMDRLKRENERNRQKALSKRRTKHHTEGE